MTYLAWFLIVWLFIVAPILNVLWIGKPRTLLTPPTAVLNSLINIGVGVVVFNLAQQAGVI